MADEDWLRFLERVARGAGSTGEVMIGLVNQWRGLGLSDEEISARYEAITSAVIELYAEPDWLDEES